MYDAEMQQIAVQIAAQIAMQSTRFMITHQCRATRGNRSGLGHVVGGSRHDNRGPSHGCRTVDSLGAGGAVVVVGVLHGSGLLYVSCGVAWDSPNLN